MLSEVDTGLLDIDRLASRLDAAEAARVREAARRGPKLLAGRSVINVNSTARGGGVAEMLRPLVAYARGVGVDSRWLVIEGDPEFFGVTKRIHNRLHGAEGDGGPLGAEERAAYEETTRRNWEELRETVAPHDVVILHDPQTAGLIPMVAAAGSPVIWRCHVGIDRPNEVARSAWAFLKPYVDSADRVVFSREQFVWDAIDPARRAVIPPSIDPLAPKNQDLSPEVAAAILRTAGLRDGERTDATARFDRLDGTAATVQARAATDETAPLRAGDPYVVQVSRWDRLKDPLGVIDGFAQHIAPGTRVHLVCAGPDVSAVTDDPEGAAVLQAARDRRSGLPSEVGERVHLALLPMEDAEENAAIVNALQRLAGVVVQKSLAEGFGLTVAEAMWKARPVVASRIGGISDQIEHGRSGLLLDDPTDLAEYGGAVRSLLDDPAMAAELGTAARERVRERFLGSQSLLNYLQLVEPLLRGAPA